MPDRPDVAALAAALQDHETSGIHGPLHCSLACGQVVADALAAQGARITFDWPPGTWHGVLPPSADDPVSAQAAPVLPDALEYRGVMWVERSVAEARTRAALDGLRAEVEGLTTVEDEDTDDWRWVSHSDVLALIDARLGR